MSNEPTWERSKPTYEDIRALCNNPDAVPMTAYLAGVTTGIEVSPGDDFETTPERVVKYLIEFLGPAFGPKMTQELGEVRRWAKSSVESRLDGALVKDAATGIAMIRHLDCVGGMEIVERQPAPVHRMVRTCAGCGQRVKTCKVEVEPETEAIGVD